MILFLRSIASFQDNGQIFIIIGGKFPGSAKIDQCQRMIRAIHQVFRADVTVQDMFLVHGLQCRKNGTHHSQGFPFCKWLFLLFHLLFEGNAGNVRHDQIGSVVAVQHIQKLYDAGNIRKTMKKLPLPGKAFHACAEIEALFFINGQYSFRIGSTTGKVSRKIFFDGNDRFRLQIHGNIGNTKATLSQWSSHQIFSLKNRKNRQCVFGYRRVGRIAAVRTDGSRIRLRLHAAGAQMLDIKHSYTSQSARSWNAF